MPFCVASNSGHEHLERRLSQVALWSLVNVVPRDRFPADVLWLERMADLPALVR